MEILELLFIDTLDFAQLTAKRFHQHKNDVCLLNSMVLKINFDGKIRRQKENSGEFAKTLMDVNNTILIQYSCS